MIDRVIELTTHPPEEDENIRLMAVTALARIRDQRALDALLRMADGGRSLLTRQQKLPQKTPVLLAVIRALAAHWPHDSRAAAVLMTAAKSSDPELRQAGAVR
jgi:HEAT repeat protein